MKNLGKWILDRLKEKSTWAGILAVVAAAGVTLNPELKDAIVAAGVSIAGLVAVIVKENK